MKPVGYLAVTTACLALLLGCLASDDRDPSPAETMQASVDSNWNAYRRDHALPGGGINIYVETPRRAHFAASGMPAGTGAHTHFRIGSNTKSFTSAAIMLLAQQGRLQVGDTIVSMIPGQTVPYVPATPAYAIPNKDTITIRQLMNHTAGVYDVTNELMPSPCPAPYAGKNYVLYVTKDLGKRDHQFTLEELIKANAVCKASYFTPGADYHYSNTGYSLLAVIIERVSGQSYDQFVIQNLLKRNDLAATTVPVLATDRAIPDPFADGYLFFRGEFGKVTESNMSANLAEGNIISTPSDLARWIRRLIRGEAGLDQASVTLMQTPTPQSGTKNYGLGLKYISGLGYGHTGAHEGYLSVMAHDPAADVTVIAYCNVWDYEYLTTQQADLLMKAARDARQILGY